MNEWKEVKKDHLADDDAEATRLALPLEMYQALKKQNKLKIALPTEECSCGSVEGVMKSLLTQYDISTLMKIRDPEHKKGKELLLACLFAYSISEVSSSKRKYDICIPYEDNDGIDIYVREIDFKKTQIFHRPIQICEMPEIWINNEKYPESLEEKIFEFLNEKKLGVYGDTNHMLLVWLELTEDRKIDANRIRELFQDCQSVGFSQIVIFGFSKPSHVSVITAYSRDSKNHFLYRYDFAKFGKV